VNKNLIFQWCFDYTDKNRQQLNRFKSVDAFNAGFLVSNTMYTDFLNYAEKKGLKHEGKNLAENDLRARTLIKAYIGRNILDNEGFYPILNTIDPGFNKAVEIIRKNR
jgi:carboxyl-terminal processing protease